MNRFFKLDFLAWSCPLLLHMFCDDIDALDDELVILWESTKDFALDRSSFFNTIFIGLDTETILPRYDTDSVSGMDFHFFHNTEWIIVTD